MMSLGRELQRRGHRVTCFQILDVEPKVLAEGLNFYPIGESDAPLGSSEQTLAQLGKLNGSQAARFTSSLIQRQAAIVCQEVPSAIKAVGVEALLVDQLELSGGTIADFLEIPFITVCNALAQNREADVPPSFVNWDYQTDWWARLRNQFGFYLVDRLFQPTYTLINEYRRQWKLPLHQSFDDFFSQVAQISQQPADFDFPRTTLPSCFHYTGPLYTPSLQSVSFPFEQLTGQPLIYASMGTLQNRQQEIFHCIAEACVGLDAQLVISLGGGGSPESLQGLPGNPLVVGYAPQLELIKKAALTITHGGLNTVLESLSNQVPMVAIPIANDQPAVGARIAWTGTGEVVPLSRLSVSKLQTAIKRVLNEDSYKKNALRLQEAIRRAGGVSRAADIVQQVVSTGKPCNISV
jgi:MGT family glycosyltransferase